MLRFSAPRCALLGFAFAFAFAPAPAAAHEATLHGLVLAVMPQSGDVVVRHDALLGRPAATDRFRIVPAAAARALHVGSSIEALADADESPWTLSNVRVMGSQSVTGTPAAVPLASVLREVHHVVVGEYAPLGTAFVDERGKRFTLRDLSGRAVVLAFVYTRCRDARECPLITAKFHQLQTDFANQPVHLVEVSLDPSYDRPSVLAHYGAGFGENPSRWTLLTGNPDTVLDFAAQFDVTAFPDERVGIIHPERLVVLDKYGAIRELIDEGSWSPDEVVATVRNDERLSSNPFERLNLWLSSAAVSLCGNAVAGFSGFTDILAIFAIVCVTLYALYRIGRAIARSGT